MWRHRLRWATLCHPGSKLPPHLEGLPVKCAEYPWAGHEEFALQVAIVVNGRAAQIRDVLSDHGSVPIASSGELHARIRSIKHACCGRAAGHNDVSRSRVLNL